MEFLRELPKVLATMLNRTGFFDVKAFNTSFIVKSKQTGKEIVVFYHKGWIRLEDKKVKVAPKDYDGIKQILAKATKKISELFGKSLLEKIKGTIDTLVDIVAKKYGLCKAKIHHFTSGKRTKVLFGKLLKISLEYGRTINKIEVNYNKDKINLEKAKKVTGAFLVAYEKLLKESFCDKNLKIRPVSDKMASFVIA